MRISPLALAAPLAAALCAPALAAPAMTGSRAEAAVKAALAEAPRDGRILSKVPVEFAGLALYFPQTGSRIPREGDPTLAQVVADKDVALAYWESVSAALAAERAREGSAPADLSAASERLERTAELARLYAAGRALVDDARADAALVRSASIRDDGAARKLLDRKIRLMLTLSGLKA
jgi:hypothetical protein